MTKNDLIYKKIAPLFPLSPNKDIFASEILRLKKQLSKRLKNDKQPRYSGQYDEKTNTALADKYSQVNVDGQPYKEVLGDIVNDLFSGVPRWRSPNILYNICAPSNTAASVIYSLCLEDNIHNVNSGLSGSTLVAEHAVAKILAGLADIQTQSCGLFTFGGTATNLYAIKVGIKKSYPKSIFSGLDGKVKILITEDSHFCHAANADWLGLGLDNAEIICANSDRTSNLKDAEIKAKKIIKNGNVLAAILINGGTTYGHTIDDIGGFIDLRDKLVKECGLVYRPHVHVDSVIGWSWLVFKGYDFEKNDLEISPKALQMIRSQYDKISQVKLADSWGVDFHKGVGVTPADSSIVMFNNFEDVSLLSKKVSVKTEMHQLASEFSSYSPVDYTLETTRSSGAPLAALVSLKVLGLEGFRRNLANLIEQSIYMRDLIAETPDFYVVNSSTLGFVTMLRLTPPGQSVKKINDYDGEEINVGNKYINEFFKWDKITRINKGIGVEYSVSSSYVKTTMGVGVTAIKLYPTSPHFNVATAKETIDTLISQKKMFDKEVWRKV